MIPKLRCLAFLLALVYTKETCGTTYSNVYVQRGSNVPPLEFLEYGTPAINVPGAQLARLALPARPILPYGAPCAVPCIPSSLPNPEISTYNSPSVPIVLETRKEVPNTYDYSYVVYDSNTGDQKSQRELSDGSSVQGLYSLMQPDGYIREVQYTADDLRGFNALVKNFLPPQANKNPEHHEVAKEKILPCHEVKNEPLVEAIHTKPQKIEASTPATEYAYELSSEYASVSPPEQPHMPSAPPSANPSAVSSAAPLDGAHTLNHEESSEQSHELTSSGHSDHSSVSSSAAPEEHHPEPSPSGETHTLSSAAPSEESHVISSAAPSEFSDIVSSAAPIEHHNEASHPEINEVVFQPAFHIAEIPLARPIGTYGSSNNEYLKCLQALLEANQIAGANKSPLFIILGGKPC